MKCPHCGHEWQQEKPPYEYSGYLKPYLDEILVYLKRGRGVRFIAIDILTRKDFVAPKDWDNGYWPRRTEDERKNMLMAVIRKIAGKYGLKTRSVRESEIEAARKEHAWILRAEGLTLREIGERLGISKERCRQMIFRFGRQNRLKRTRFYFNDKNKTDRARSVLEKVDTNAQIIP